MKPTNTKKCPSCGERTAHVMTSRVSLLGKETVTTTWQCGLCFDEWTDEPKEVKS